MTARGNGKFTTAKQRAARKAAGKRMTFFGRRVLPEPFGRELVPTSPTGVWIKTVPADLRKLIDDAVREKEEA